MKNELYPTIHLNLAMTADGKIDTVERQGAAISSAWDKARVDQLRAASDAVMVGGRTLLDDDPKLTVKSEALKAARISRGLQPNPVKVGVVSVAALRPDADFLKAGPARRLIFTTRRTSAEQCELLQRQGVEVFTLGEDRVDLVAMLRILKEEDIQHLMVEGGATLNYELLRLELVDTLTIYVAPMILGGETAPTLAGGSGLAREQAVPLKLVQAETHEDGGVLLHYQVSS
ncbi:MAG: dihydrofolate reductase family protein [Anaerolineales bacterium]|nr:dihydrofolate reductase family protein [Anaerolineales bacterium]